MLEQITNYINKEIDILVSQEEELLSSGLIDSITIMKLIAHLEETYQIKVPPQDMVIENFNTVSSIRDYIAQQQNK
ncbi:acyl carrier protein [Algoriphagus yeomjeoni]|uniref:Phosphopantetheine binding protein n=1 Tax=Algoriphagus yeomjeoni TaxID=291403 RepID=A0A327PJP4_9BACT|nr:phosphopantetheine-binding protein [Algoriphagus yeomjeoni]RAI91432.1 phosphopantetheine binding protein [Algoriphagus yeomjeoni]